MVNVIYIVGTYLSFFLFINCEYKETDYVFIIISFWEITEDTIW